MSGTALVYGMAVAGQATAVALLRRGWRVIAADDRADAAPLAAGLGLELLVAPSDLDRLVRQVDLVVPAPGVSEHHPLIGAAQTAGVPLRSEIDLAWEWEHERPNGPRPMLGITGTDGKTTVTLLATAMVEASGWRAVAAGNTELPLVSAIDLDVDVFVVECTSFRLAWTTCFRPVAGTWLNLAADHLDWHRTMAGYEAAKARLWAFQGPDDVAVGYPKDPIVRRNLEAAPGRHVTFAAQGADYEVRDGWLVGPDGPFVPVEDLPRSLPHDVTNTLAAAATVLESACATVEGVAAAAASFQGLHHRIEHVADHGGVAYFDDSKATTTHAARTAIRSFPSVVLIAGGRNKGLDLGELAYEVDRVRAVVAIGEAAEEVIEAFDGRVPVVVADSMDAAVASAAEAAEPGDAVLLSPACASFDWYHGYAERGDDFARAVRQRLGAR